MAPPLPKDLEEQVGPAASEGRKAAFLNGFVLGSAVGLGLAMMFVAAEGVHRIIFWVLVFVLGMVWVLAGVRARHKQEQRSYQYRDREENEDVQENPDRQ